MRTNEDQKLNGAAKLAKINEALAAGHTVYISTALSCTKITPRTAERWAKAGQDLFRVDSRGSLLLRAGKRWDCIDYCKLEAWA